MSRPCASTASPVTHVYISLVICRPFVAGLWFLSDGADRRSQAKPKQAPSPPQELLFSPLSPYSGLHPGQIFRGARRQPKHLTLGDPPAHWPGRLPLPLTDVPMHQSRGGSDLAGQAAQTRLRAAVPPASASLELLFFSHVWPLAS